MSNEEYQLLKFANNLDEVNTIVQQHQVSIYRSSNLINYSPTICLQILSVEKKNFSTRKDNVFPLFVCESFAIIIRRV